MVIAIMQDVTDLAEDDQLGSAIVRVVVHVSSRYHDFIGLPLLVDSLFPFSGSAVLTGIFDQPLAIAGAPLEVRVVVGLLLLPPVCPVGAQSGLLC